ncbi:hypothetical protein HUE56_22815 (plasmid) [Azospirillum oryzae]|uniref:Uncharacterized protein n=2 Tax=Azospirillum oryzae TaxID=286727 RepID=A0A6N1AP60_9PROT|nr:hypothetical protein [Azospirillum oryzae]KAA0584994.1 hypothetical protein FZ938_26985 [Azospirillum oryzae]QKS53360.1 hypothetical protein HUE56_22815 [Azospirillum oryzae]
MNAETGSEPESPKKRGRIPQSAWPQILERYRSGATLSAIAREFECTPSAISYIIKKAEAASGQGDAAHGDAGAEGMQDEAQAADGTSSAAPETVGEAPVTVTPAVPEAPAATPAPASPAAAESETPAEPRRAAGRTGRTTLTRAPRTEPAAEQASAETPAAAPAPAPTETLRLNRPESAAAPAPAPVAAPAPAQTSAAPEAPRAPGQPTPPVDAVEGRLRDTAKACISAYRGWRQQPSEATIQSLSETVHELRKALARVEIDMSASRREEQAIRPIPIPAHRASRRPN